MVEEIAEMNICVVGKGVVGSEIARKIKKKNRDAVFTIDINPDTSPDYASMEEFNEEHMADVYIICVWTQKQLLDVISKIKLDNKPLISIETAAEVGSYEKAKRIIGDNAHLVVFHERLYPNDDMHGIFNQQRVLGGEDYERGRRFYLKYMIWENIITTKSGRLAELCKIAENAYRYVTIALAEELKMLVGDDFEELRNLMNTKWNIDLPEAREGIEGRCLPKDIGLLDRYFPDNQIFKAAISANKEYIEWKKEKK